MSFNPFAPEGPMRARLLTHVALTTAVQGVYNTVAPDDISLGRGKMPVVVITHVSTPFNDSFQYNAVTATYQVSVYDSKLNGDDAAKTIVGYVIGNSEGTDNAPTYGLHRWQMTGVTDTAASLMRGLECRSLHDGDTLHYAITFEVEIQEA